MAITTMDQLVAAMASAQYIDAEASSMASKAAGTFQSLWKAPGRPAPGNSPASVPGVVCTSATAGAMGQNDASGGNTLYLAHVDVSSSTAESLILYDRLIHSDGLSGTVITAQTVGTPTLTRFVGGVGVGLWLEVYTPTGSTATTATVSYTNQSGVAGRSGTCAWPASPVAGQMVPVNLQSGDEGVQAVATVTLTASTLTAGSFGVTLAARIGQLPITLANTGIVCDYAMLGLPVIPAGACLASIALCTATNTGIVISGFTFAQG